MSRRRAQKQQEKEEFLDQNPELRTFTTEIKVVEAESHSSNSQSVGVSSDSDQMITPYTVEATRDGEDVLNFVAINGVFPDLTTVSSFETAPGFFQAGSSGMSEGNIRDVRYEMNVLSLSEDGFGVAQGNGHSDSGASQPLILDTEWVEVGPDSQDYALNGDELIIFSAPSGFDRETQMEVGATEFGIDYTVLGGRGTVEIVLVDSKGVEQRSLTGPETVEATSAFLRSGQEGSLEAVMPDGTYGTAIISVTGSLEIAIVGIDVTSNTDNTFAL